MFPEENLANPETGAEDTSLTVNDVYERLKESSQKANEESQVDEGEAEEVDPEPGEETPEPVAEVESEAEPEPVEEVEQPKRRHKVNPNGQEMEVTLDELKKGFMLEADYRKKTTEVAEQRRQIEAERQHIQGQLKELIPALESQFHGKFANVDWVKLAHESPAEYTALRAEAEQEMARLQMARAEQQRIEHLAQQEQARVFKERVAAEQAKLREIIPDFATPEKAKALQAEIRSYLRSTGFEDRDLDGMADHRMVVTAWKAMQFDNAKKATAEAAKKAVNVPKVQKPGTPSRVDPKQTQASAAEARFAKTGKVNDLAAALLARNASTR